MRPKGEAPSTVLDVAKELWPAMFRLRRLAGIADDVEPVGPIREVRGRWSAGRWAPAADGTYVCCVDALGRVVLAVPERIDPFDPSVPDVGWCVTPPPYMLDPGDVVEFFAKSPKGRRR